MRHMTASATSIHPRRSVASRSSSILSSIALPPHRMRAILAMSTTAAISSSTITALKAARSNLL